MIQELLQTSYLQNRVLDYLYALVFFLAGIIVISIIKHVTRNRLKKWAEKTATSLDNFLILLIEKKMIPLLYFGALYLAVKSLTLSPALNKFLNIAGGVLLTILAVRLLTAVAGYSIDAYSKKRALDTGIKQSYKGIITIITVFIWGIGITFLLDNLGFKISTVIAGLGIGGIAVALAAQTILGDLFSYFVIFFDRPFEIGDFIIIGEYMGTIENIGIKTTRVRSLGGEQLVFSNTDLTNSRIRNYKRMEKRRVVFKFGVVYQATLEQVKEIPSLMKTIIERIDNTVFDRAHFASYGDFSLDYEVVYYVMSSDYNKYMDIQQEINFVIKEEFEKRGIEFAYPTQTLFVDKTQENS